MLRLTVIFVFLYLGVYVAVAFHPFSYSSVGNNHVRTSVSSSTCLYNSMEAGQQDLLQVRSFLEQNYPEFFNLIDKNDDLWKKLSDGDGYTMFVPSAKAFADLGAKKLDQLDDPRNSETTDKIGSFHCIAETVTFDALFNSGGVITLEGEVMVDRSKSGGVLGMGGQEDGGVLVNEAKITQTIEVGPGVIHEVDKLVNPNILWRYMDQLRIPGSR